MTHDGLLRRVVGPRQPGGLRAPLPASLPSRAAAARWRIRRPNR